MRILLVEDSVLVQEAILRLIKNAQPSAIVNTVDNAPEAIRHLDTYAYDYIVSDFDLKSGTGADVLKHVRQRFAFYIANNRFILMSGDLRPAITGLDHPLTFEKPIRPDKFRALLGGQP